MHRSGGTIGLGEDGVRQYANTTMLPGLDDDLRTLLFQLVNHFFFDLVQSLRGHLLFVIIHAYRDEFDFDLL